MGVLTVQEMWYSCGGCEQLENRLEVLVDDGGAIEMLKIENTHGEVHLFLVHVVLEAEVLFPLGDVVEPEGVKGNVEDGCGVEPKGVEGNVEDGGGVEPEGVEADVEDGGGVDIGDHHGMKGAVEEDDEEDEGYGGQGIGPPIHENMECDNDGVDDDGGHVLEDSFWLREVEFIEGEIEAQSEVICFQLTKF